VLKPPLKNDFFQIFFNISFHITPEAKYSKFGHPKSIMADSESKGGPIRLPWITLLSLHK
jgi:hypothetical protein